jgi:hypothetical protein
MRIQRLVLALLFALSSLSAGEIQLTAGPATAFQSVDFVEVSVTASERLLVTSTATLNLTYSFAGDGPQLSDCLFAGNGSLCDGTVNDSASIDGIIATSVDVSGDYEFTKNGETSNIAPQCGFQAVSECNFLLNPGLYTFSATVYDDLGQSLGATATPFTEGFTGILTWSSGDVQVFVPEPSTAVLLFVPLAIGIPLRRRRR